MNREDYLKIVEKAPRLDRRLFDLSNKQNIDRLEELLSQYSNDYGQSMIGAPLVQPYGGPTCEYILLPETQYWKMRKALKKSNWTVGCNEIGILYDKNCLNTKRKILEDSCNVPLKINDLIERIKRSHTKIEVYTDPSSYYL